QMLDASRGGPESGVGIRTELHDERLRIRERRRGLGPARDGALRPHMSSVMHHASSKDIMRPGAGEVPREPPNLSKTFSRRSVPEEPGDYESPKAGWIGSRPGLEAAVAPEVPRRTVGA